MGLALPIVLGYLLLDIDFWAIVKTAFSAHSEVTTTSFRRTYWKWVIVNLLDFGGALGVTAIVWLCWSGRRLAARNDHLRRGEVTPLALLLAWALTLLLLDVSGVVRAEVARIWMFLLPPGAALCGALCIKHHAQERVDNDAGRQEMIERATMNVHYIRFACLQLVQAIVLCHEVIFIRFY